MKITFRQIEPFVKNPDRDARVILVYGPDNGLMRERAKTMGLSVVTDYSDPFNVAVLSTSILLEDPARLYDEAGAISMMGGERLIRVEAAGDKITPLIKEYLKSPGGNALVILEAGELGPRSSLRKLCEKSKNAAALPCYVEDERDLSRLIRDILEKAGMNAEHDAVSWLATNISGNRMKVRSELEKLIIYKGPGDNSPITLADVNTICGEAGTQGLDDLVYSVGGRQNAQAMRVYNQLIAEDVPFIVILRSLQNHFRRLHLTKSRMKNGDPPEKAMKRLAPPVFFKQQQAFRGQLQLWSLPVLNTIMSRLMDVEAQCKTTGMPVETICAQTVLGISSVRI